MIDFFSLFVVEGVCGWGGYSCACFVIEGGVYFVCEMYWADGGNVGMFSVVEHNVRKISEVKSTK